MGHRHLSCWVVLVAGMLVLAGCGSGRRPTAGPTTTTRPTSPTGIPVGAHTVLGLGDSVTAGSACDCTDFVQLVARGLAAAQHTPVRAVNRGQGGQTAAQLLALLEHNGRLRAQVRRSDVVLVIVGANDLVPALDDWSDGECDAACAGRDVLTTATDVAAAVALVRSLRAGRPTQLLVTDYWNVFEDGDVGRADRGDAYLAWSDALTRRFNAALCPRVVRAGAICVDLYQPFKGGGADPSPLLADDGDHPNAAGHALIARTLLSHLAP